MEFYISSPQNGGLYLYNGTLSKLDEGNIRGMTRYEDRVCYVKGPALHTPEGKLFDLPSQLGHDIRYYDGRFYFMATEIKKLFQLSAQGEIQKETSFDDSFWPNCCWPLQDGLIVFLSKKRPYSKSKILCYDNDWQVKWEYNCFDNDEIHSPYLVGDDLYWCRSNFNSVVRASLSSRLRDIQRILINNDGYTRGLCVCSGTILLGTSENRHAENSQCQANMKCGCVHVYTNGEKTNTIPLDCNEVYDLLC